MSDENQERKSLPFGLMLLLGVIVLGLIMLAVKLIMS
jgi:hypothetical protein